MTYKRTFGEGSWPDSFNYTVTDGELSDVGTVTVVIDCGCVIACYLINLGRSSQGDTLDLPPIYRTNILTKLNFASRTQIAAWAVEMGLLN